MTDHTPLTGQREQQIRTLDLAPLMSDRSAAVISGHLAVLLGEIDRLRAERDKFCDRVDTLTAVAKGNKRHVQEMFRELQKAQAALEEIRHLHKDSPMGPCPVCIDADRLAAGGDGLVPYPCPTSRLAGAKDCDPPHVRAERCPGFEKEYQGVSDAKRRLANCKHCGQPRTAHPAARPVSPSA